MNNTKTNNMKNMKNKSPKNEKIVEEIETLKKTNILNTYLGNKGYSIFKICLNDKLIKFIKDELTVRPFVQNTIVKPNDFPVYQESDKKIYVPRFWGIKYFGEPKEIKISYGKCINLTFKGELRDYQTNVLNNYLKKINYNEDDTQNKGNSSALIELWTGAGKTVLALKILQVLKKKTILFVHKSFLKDQWIERIEQYLPDAKIGIIQGQIIDIENKDIVIAMIQSISMKSYPDSLFDDFGLSIYDECFKGNTLIHTNKGKIKIAELYDIWEKKDNIEILSFNREKETFEYKPLTYAWKKESKEFIKFTLSKQKLECTLNHKILTPNGYIEANKLEIGSLILSKYDINHNDNLICPCLNEDQLQIVYGSFLGDGCIQKTKSNRYRLRIIHCKKQKDYCLWKANMFGINKLNYIEKNGYSQKEAYSFNTKCFDLTNEINDSKIVPEIVINNINEKGIAIWFMDDGSIMKRELKNKTISYFAKISSNNFDYTNHLILVRIFEKWNIIPKIMKCKKYYELHFDKNNTQKLFDLIMPYIHENLLYKTNNTNNTNNTNTNNTNNANCIKYNWNNNFLKYGTLKITKKEYISDKKANVYDIEVKDNHNFILATKSKTNYIDGPIVSNCHHISSEIFSNCLRKCTTLYSLGLSATMNRKDGLTHVFKMYLGDICNKDSKQEQPKDDVLVKAIDFDVIDDDEYNEIEYDFRGTVKYTTMVSKISNYSFRSDFIVNVIENELNINKNQQFIVLAQTKNLLNYLFKAIKFKEISSVGYYVGGMKQHELKESESKQIILATYSMAAEGLDIKSLTTLVLASPKSDIVQSVGRILREKHSKPLIIDIIDKHSPFINQFQKRKSFYNQKEYKIIRTNKERYLNYIKTVNNAIKNNATFEDILDKSIWNEIIPKSKKTNTSNITNKKGGNIINIDVNTDEYEEDTEDTDLLIEKKFKCLL